MAQRRAGQASKGRRGRHSAPARSLPGWVWALSGLAIGLFVALLVHLNNGPPGQESSISALLESPSEQSDETTGDAPKSTAVEKPDDKPRFEFYKLLPEQEVEVPDPQPSGPIVDAPPEAVRPLQPPPQAPRDDAAMARLLLQAGSFRDFKDADRLKASLALLGVEARIQQVQLASGDTWHRVRIGPFGDRQRLNQVRERLQDNNVETILLKRGG